jgi:hypothetical protein
MKQMQHSVQEGFFLLFFIMSHILGTFVAQYKVLNIVYSNLSYNVVNSLTFSVIVSLNVIDFLQFSPSTHNCVSRITSFNLLS